MMPSLFRYFTIVGGVLVALLVLVNSILEPGGPGPTMVKAAPKIAIKHDPRASLVERLRAEEAAQKAVKVEIPTTAPVSSAEPAAPTAQPVTAVSAQVNEPAQAIAPAALATAPTEDMSARAVRLAQEKMKSEKARKQRLARERAKAMEQAASRHQDQLYYGYAPQRQAYGPFGPQNGQFGGGWGQRW